jgi:hypothetical protein
LQPILRLLKLQLQRQRRCRFERIFKVEENVLLFKTHQDTHGIVNFYSADVVNRSRRIGSGFGEFSSVVCLFALSSFLKIAKIAIINFGLLFPRSRLWIHFSNCGRFCSPTHLVTLAVKQHLGHTTQIKKFLILEVGAKSGRTKCCRTFFQKIFFRGNSAQANLLAPGRVPPEVAFSGMINYFTYMAIESKRLYANLFLSLVARWNICTPKILILAYFGMPRNRNF